MVQVGKGPIEGGHDAYRVSTAPGDVTVRDERVAGARRNLAKWLVDRAGGPERLRADPQLLNAVAAEFEDVCRALGLAEPHKRQGECARPGCTNDVPASRSARSGCCSMKCEKVARLGGYAQPRTGG